MSNQRYSIPPPNSLEELKYLGQLVRHTREEFHRLDVQEQDVLLHKLTEYECYGQLTHLLKWRISKGNHTQEQIFTDTLWLHRIMYSGSEDFDALLQFSKDSIARLSLPFSTIRIYILERIIGNEKPMQQAKYLESIRETLEENSQKILLQEYLCRVYEKKLFLESKIYESYEKLLELDPFNIKALKFFRLWYIQNQDWNEAKRCLEVIMAHTKNPFDKERAAHELGQLLLYQLKDPLLARDVILRNIDPPFKDVKHTIYVILERLGLYDEMVDHLNHAEEYESDPRLLVALKLKKAGVLVKSGASTEAIFAMEECLPLQPGNLRIYERMVEVYSGEKRVQKLINILQKLNSVVKIPESHIKIDNLITKLQTAL